MSGWLLGPAVALATGAACAVARAEPGLDGATPAFAGVPLTSTGVPPGGAVRAF